MGRMEVEGLEKTTSSGFLNDPAQTYISLQSTHSLPGEGTVPPVGPMLWLVFCGLTFYISEEIGILEAESAGLLDLSGS